MRWWKVRWWQSWIRRRWDKTETDYTQLAMRLKFKNEKSMRQQSQSRELDDDERKQENSV